MKFRWLCLFSIVMLVAVSPLSAENSRLSFSLSIDSECGEHTIYTDCASEIEINVTIQNLRDYDVEEGSIDLPESLDIFIYDSAGRVVAWWEPEDYSVPGVARIWEPRDSERFSLVWPLTRGAISDRIPSSQQPLVPYDGYRIEIVWYSFDNVELFRHSAYVERMPGSFEDWPIEYGSYIRFVQPEVAFGRPVTVLAQAWRESTPAWATTRWFEFNEEGTLQIFVASQTGPFSAPSAFQFAIRLPPLDEGSYPVEIWQVMYSNGEPFYFFETSSVLEIDHARIESEVSLFPK